MKLSLLMSPEQRKSMPKEVVIIEDWGHTEICLGEDLKNTVCGSHVYLEAEMEVFKEWLKPFDVVWVGHGPAFLQQFTSMHIKEGA